MAGLGGYVIGRARRSDEGSAAVEFALVLPLLVVLLFGMIELGMVFNAKIAITHAAREGARVASIGKGAAAVVGAVRAQTTSLVAARVAVTGPTAMSDPARGDYYEITVRYTYPLDIPLWGEREISLHSTAQMRKEN